MEFATRNGEIGVGLASPSGADVLVWPQISSVPPAVVVHGVALDRLSVQCPVADLCRLGPELFTRTGFFHI